MKSTQSELIWLGKTHLGDEPGIFSNASYGGLAFELPITVKSFSGSKMSVSLILRTEFVKVFSGYKGHKVTITMFVPNSSTPNQYDYKEVILLEDYITDSVNDKILNFEIEGKHIFLSCKLEVDTSVTPGLYDDFLFSQLNFKANNHEYFASLGFK